MFLITNMSEPIDTNIQELILQKLLALESSHAELSEHLLNEVPIKRQKRLEEEAGRAVLTKKQKEWQEKYKKQNIDLRGKPKSELGEHWIGGKFRYFDPQVLTSYPCLILEPRMLRTSGFQWPITSKQSMIPSNLSRKVPKPKPSPVPTLFRLVKIKIPARNGRSSAVFVDDRIGYVA